MAFTAGTVTSCDASRNGQRRSFTVPRLGAYEVIIVE